MRNAKATLWPFSHLLWEIAISFFILSCYCFDINMRPQGAFIKFILPFLFLRDFFGDRFLLARVVGGCAARLGPALYPPPPGGQIGAEAGAAARAASSVRSAGCKMLPGDVSTHDAHIQGQAASTISRTQQN
nr:MAG TPA: hypothetical protein [Caudoviricetes sp.]